MNRAQRIRQWLACHGRGTARQIADGLEGPGATNVAAYSCALSAMESSGMVRSTKKAGQRRVYRLGRKPARTPTPRVFTGRASRIRALLHAADRGYTVAEIRTAVDPDESSARVSASLGTLAKQGHIAGANSGRLTCYARTQAIAKRALAEALAARASKSKPKPTAKPPKKPPAKRSPKPHAGKRATPPPARHQAPPARPVPRGLPKPPPPSAAMSESMRTLARRRPVARPAPVTCSLDGVSDQQRQASARIAADIAAFEARGGRIESLGPTQFFNRIGAEAANHAPPRRPRTGTLALDD